MSYENIIFDVKEDRAFLTINRPPMNILDIATMGEMNDAITSLNDNKNIKALIITGSGEKAFSAGVDVTEHTEEKVKEMLRVFHDIFRNLSKLNQVTIAAAKGFTLGGGCEVALFCDMIFAADNLKIGQPEIKLSVIPPHRTEKSLRASFQRQDHRRRGSRADRVGQQNSPVGCF